MMRMLLSLITCLAVEVDVADDAQLRKALAEARPGTTIRIAPGRYAGGGFVRELRGEPNAPILIRGADPKRPPVIQGGTFGLQLSRVAHVELRDLIVAGASDNGINIDDGGELETPSHHVVLRNLTIRDIGPEGNHDGVKLSGLADFRVEGCTLERWGANGSGIDMVGCRRGEVVDSTFRHGDEVGSSGVQMKGGTRDVAVRRCRFEHAGQRAVNLGGSTGLPFFRPKPEGFEGKDLLVEDCTFVGSASPVAFVGVDGATVRRNTLYRPRYWAFRILQENRSPGFVLSRGGKFVDNLIVYRSDELRTAVNVGSGAAPETFTLAGNAWYALDDPAHSRPKLPVPEAGGVYGVEPHFVDAAKGDLRLDPKLPDPRASRRPAE
ncbi:right-handed parallel beta-helix repeat-containing protein [Paludisphaera mucosa]|uniref:Right-handed parallel beta-helix repeat-containing protein n=1 Tax=Paludisphaera mucosa TaxID=3030827 RepID=A0ABT6F4R4_9BACT|nr:right-handed parallel beta-helix repeat-containing protein [Paludisphaera mucosa]MDG3002566.1 right-handed parallel beta-helix repeat-containing protein [Paludisphaera mucosa]